VAESEVGMAAPNPGRRGRSVRAVLMAAGGYTLLSVLLWWNIWSTHPTSTTTCGCGDTSLFTWFLAWPAYAFSHGLNPLYSTALFHPTGTNLLSNTAEVGIGVVLAPVTWLFGAVATLNVALTLSPALSALAMFILLRRWVAWEPAAFLGGLLYGFSPFVIIALTDSHLMLGMAPVPPLIVACLDELFVRQRRRPVVAGAVFGVLVAVQFFIGSEILVLTAIAGVIGVILVVAANARHRDVLRQRVRHAVVGLATAGGAAAVLLAYPVWFALAGPAHLAGPIWGPDTLISYGGTNVKDYVLPTAPSASFTALGHRFGGYQGATLSGQYLGIGLLAVLVVGLILWRRDKKLWLFGVVGVISVFLSFGLQMHGWTAWRLFVRFPMMENIIPSRFLLVTYLAASVMLALIVDHAHDGVRRFQERRQRSRPSGPAGRRKLLAAVAGVVVGGIALGPIAGYEADGVPLTATPVILPSWFRTVAPHLRGHQVILAFPVPFDLLQSAMTWQAVDTMSYAMVGGGGPGSISERAGKERAGQNYIGTLSAFGSSLPITPKEILAVRQALNGWGVTMVVIPDPAPLPRYEQLGAVRETALLMTAAIGAEPVRQAGAWVWSRVGHAGAPVLLSAARSTVCGAGPAVGSVASIYRSTACVLAGSDDR
jgi:hypothetical protein